MRTALSPDGERFIAPRQIAATIAKQPDHTVRAKMLANVQGHWQELVKTHLVIRMERMKHDAK